MPMMTITWTMNTATPTTEAMKTSMTEMEMNSGTLTTVTMTSTTATTSATSMKTIVINGQRCQYSNDFHGQEHGEDSNDRNTNTVSDLPVKESQNKTSTTSTTRTPRTTATLKITTNKAEQAGSAVDNCKWTAKLKTQSLLWGVKRTICSAPSYMGDGPPGPTKLKFANPETCYEAKHDNRHFSTRVPWMSLCTNLSAANREDCINVFNFRGFTSISGSMQESVTKLIATLVIDCQTTRTCQK